MVQNYSKTFSNTMKDRRCGSFAPEIVFCLELIAGVYCDQRDLKKLISGNIWFDVITVVHFFQFARGYVKRK